MKESLKRYTLKYQQWLSQGGEIIENLPSMCFFPYFLHFP